LPKVVAQQRRGRASNPRLLDRKSDALPLATPPRHRVQPSGLQRLTTWPRHATVTVIIIIIIITIIIRNLDFNSVSFPLPLLHHHRHYFAESAKSRYHDSFTVATVHRPGVQQVVKPWLHCQSKNVVTLILGITFAKKCWLDCFFDSQCGSTIRTCTSL